MKRIFTGLLLGLFLLGGSSALRAEDFWASHEVACPEERPGCLLLQMIRMGSFEQEVSQEDPVFSRVLSAAYPRLCKVTQEDFTHFLLEYPQEEMDEVEAAFERAFSACLLADIRSRIRSGEEMQAEERVLLLFLSPEEEKDAEEQQSYIRQNMTDEVLEKLAEAVNASLDYVRNLLGLEE